MKKRSLKTRTLRALMLVVAFMFATIMGAVGTSAASATPSSPTTTSIQVAARGGVALPALPSNCYTWAGNMVGAWPTAYAKCSSGTGQFRVVGQFKSFLSGQIYTLVGPWKYSGSTSQVGALGLLDWCRSASVQRR